MPMFFALGDNRVDVPVRATSFAVKERTLFCPRVRLYPDRLVFTGWYLWGRYRRSISLDRIEEAEAEAEWVRLDLSGEAELQFNVPNPNHWARAILVYREVREG